ncbi:acyl-CoA thioesterase [Aliterella atlantica]|uniref:4-hydroxybenzoyl-CoA thioesterase n=1 Tax=Aliterella atlantica CENA595 TaxID=1618023 RepID=A0A0D8ZXZ6_9CYAN|nr:thioesterase family protein [Aliterella atlantica]KJH73309.1 4-hydroxybenzoyl-CoA thioesterase [Aliterella atlantica CENA595]
MKPFITNLRVRHYEMDALGHVNNAVYQSYLEQAAIEHSEHLGLTLDVYRQLGGVFVMRRLEIDYLRPAVAGDSLDIATWLQQLRGPRAIRRYEIRQHDSEPLLVTAEAMWVWVEAATMRPRAIPKLIQESFNAANT